MSTSFGAKKSPRLATGKFEICLAAGAALWLRLGCAERDYNMRANARQITTPVRSRDRLFQK